MPSPDSEFEYDDLDEEGQLSIDAENLTDDENDPTAYFDYEDRDFEDGWTSEGWESEF